MLTLAQRNAEHTIPELGWTIKPFRLRDNTKVKPKLAHTHCGQLFK